MSYEGERFNRIINLIEAEIEKGQKIINFDGAYAMVTFAYKMDMISESMKNSYTRRIDELIDEAFEASIGD